MTLFAKRLKELRLEHGYTLQKTAKLLNLTHVAYLRWEQGKTQPGSIETIVSICEIFDVSADYLLGIKDY